MKRGTPEHPKTLNLAGILGIEDWGAVGILEKLWHWTAKYAPDGSLSKYSSSEIARGIGWRGDPMVLMSALIQARWIDQNPRVGIYVHDWAHHAEDSVHQMLGRNYRYFADGTIPKLTGLNVKERPEIEKKYRANPFIEPTLQNMPTNSPHVDNSAAHVPLAVALAVALPLPLPLPLKNITAPNDARSDLPEEKPLKPKKGTVQKNGYNPVALWHNAIGFYKKIQSPKMTGFETRYLTELGNLYSKQEFQAMLKAYGEDHEANGKPWRMFDEFYKLHSEWRSKARVGSPGAGSEEALAAVMANCDDSMENIYKIIGRTPPPCE